MCSPPGDPSDKIIILTPRSPPAAYDYHVIFCTSLLNCLYLLLFNHTLLFVFVLCTMSHVQMVYTVWSLDHSYTTNKTRSFKAGTKKTIAIQCTNHLFTWKCASALHASENSNVNKVILAMIVISDVSGCIYYMVTRELMFSSNK